MTHEEHNKHIQKLSKYFKDDIFIKNKCQKNKYKPKPLIRQNRSNTIDNSIYDWHQTLKIYEKDEQKWIMYNNGLININEKDIQKAITNIEILIYLIENYYICSSREISDKSLQMPNDIVLKIINILQNGKKFIENSNNTYNKKRLSFCKYSVYKLFIYSKCIPSYCILVLINLFFIAYMTYMIYIHT
jgi:hypothetical protein